MMHSETTTVSSGPNNYNETHCNICGLSTEEMTDYEICDSDGKLFCYPECLEKHEKASGHKQVRLVEE